MKNIAEIEPADLVATGATMVTLPLPRLASATPALVKTDINKLYPADTLGWKD